MNARTSAVLLLAGAGSWWWTQGCHAFHACNDGPCEPSRSDGGSSAGDAQSGGATPSGAGGAAAASSDNASGAGDSPDGAGGAGGSPDGAGGADHSTDNAGQAGSNANANEAGAGGSGGDAECVFPRADCDESAITVCEANLLRDVRNCGACRAHCSGACIDGKCSPFEVLAEDMWLPARGGIALTSNEVYALSTAFDNTLVRWSAQQGAQTLFAGSYGFSGLLIGVDRLYLFGFDGGLSSVFFSGGAVSSEGTTARTAVIHGNTLYAVDDTGAPYRRAEVSHETGALPLPVPAPDPSHVWLAADSFDVALVTGNGDGDDRTYTVYYLDGSQQPAWVPVTSGSGNPAQVRLESKSVFIDVVLPHDEAAADWQIAHELRQVAFDGTTRVVSTMTGLLDFDVVSSRLYLSVALAQQKSMLRVVAVDDSSAPLDVQTSATMASLTYFRRYFYFGDSSRNRLSRLRNWVE